MKPRGRPFEPGNRMGRGRKIPLIGLCIRKASQGDIPSMRLYMNLL